MWKAYKTSNNCSNAYEKSNVVNVCFMISLIYLPNCAFIITFYFKQFLVPDSHCAISFRDIGSVNGYVFLVADLRGQKRNIKIDAWKKIWNLPLKIYRFQVIFETSSLAWTPDRIMRQLGVTVSKSALKICEDGHSSSFYLLPSIL